MDVIIQVLTLLVSSGIAGQLLYYNSRKRKEAAADKVKLNSLPSITSKLSNITAATTTEEVVTKFNALLADLKAKGYMEADE